MNMAQYRIYRELLAHHGRWICPYDLAHKLNLTWRQVMALCRYIGPGMEYENDADHGDLLRLRFNGSADDVRQIEIMALKDIYGIDDSTRAHLLELLKTDEWTPITILSKEMRMSFSVLSRVVGLMPDSIEVRQGRTSKEYRRIVE